MVAELGYDALPRTNTRDSSLPSVTARHNLPVGPAHVLH